VGIVAVLFWVFMTTSWHIHAAVATAVVVAFALFCVFWVFRAVRRKDPPVAYGMLIGLAIIGLIGGWCVTLPPGR
jgi:hypothetical protein